MVNCNIVELEQDFVLFKKILRNLISNCHNNKYLFVNIYVFDLHHINVMQPTVSAIPFLQ